MTTASPAYRFGEFRLDPATHKLSRGDDDVPLPPRVFNCLVYLIEHRERAVERDELIAALWGDVHLSDKVLDQTILRARRALGDTGQERQFIETVWGFGYRWAAPVEVGDAPIAAERGSGRRAAWLWILLAVLGIGTIVGGATYLRWNPSAPSDSPLSDGDIVLVLPVVVEADESFAWVRLGLMDLIAQRLRAAGQATVPSDTVIALLRGHPVELGPEELESLTAATGARLVLRAEAATSGARWHVSLRGLTGTQRPIAAHGEAEDVLAAALHAADRMALSLGLTPAPEPDTEPALATLLQRVEAAMLAQQHDAVRELIEAAGPELRQHPEVRYQMARTELSRHDLDAARAAFESLLTGDPEEQDPVLRARVLHSLGWVYSQRADLDAAERVLGEAVDLVEQGEDPALFGVIRSMLGVVALHRGDLDAARVHFTTARVALQSTGSALGLAALDNHLGLLETQRERYAEALRYFEDAATWSARAGDIGAELGLRANIILTHLGLLDPGAAEKVESRVRELLEQTTSPDITSWADLTRAYLLEAQGRHAAAESLLAEVLDTVEGNDNLHWLGLAALVLRAEQAARRGDSALTARVAQEVVDGAPADYVPLAEERGRAWLILVRAHLARGHREAAAASAAALADWARRGDVPSAPIYSALADAEVAAADGRDEAAGSAFERALALADASPLPLRLLQVTESYVAWLLGERRHGPTDPQRALVVAGRVAKYADRHYGAALLQLRATHAVDATAAWRSALVDARSLAGVHRIPPRLEIPPR